MRRVTSRELLDDDLGTSQEINGNLDDLWRINRWLGGVSSNLTLLGHFFSCTGAHAVRILEVGAGDARLAACLRRKLSHRHIRADFFVLDRRRSHLLHGPCLAAGLHPVVADVAALPFAAGSFHVVMCNLLFHHFSGDQARGVLRHLASIATEALVINDLERNVLPYLLIRSVPWLLRSRRLTRHDGPASVRQAYTRREITALAASAGFKNFEVQSLTPFRWGLTVWTRGNLGAPQAWVRPEIAEGIRLD